MVISGMDTVYNYCSKASWIQRGMKASKECTPVKDSPVLVAVPFRSRDPHKTWINTKTTHDSNIEGPRHSFKTALTQAKQMVDIKDSA